MTEFGLSELELENKEVRKTFFTLKKNGTIQKLLSALFFIRCTLPENQGHLHGVFRRVFL